MIKAPLTSIPYNKKIGKIGGWVPNWYCKILADFKSSGSVQDCHINLADFNLVVVKADRQTTKFFIPCQIFQLYSICDIML